MTEIAADDGNAFLRRIRTGLPQPGASLEGTWRVSIRDAAAAYVTIGAVNRLPGLLDRFGAISVGPQGLGLDGEEVSWRDIERIDVGHGLDVVTTTALAREAEALASRLPPVPGRKWLVRTITRTILSLGADAVVAVQRTTGSGPQRIHPVPVSVTCKGRMGRRKVLAPGVFASVVCVLEPRVTELVLDLARQNGVTVAMPPPADMSARAAALGAGLRQLRERAAALRDSSDGATDQAAQQPARQLAEPFGPGTEIGTLPPEHAAAGPVAADGPAAGLC